MFLTSDLMATVMSWSKLQKWESTFLTGTRGNYPWLYPWLDFVPWLSKGVSWFFKWSHIQCVKHLDLQSKLNAELWFPACLWMDCSLEEFCYLCLYYEKVRIFFFFFQNGEIQPVSVKVGEKVLLPEYGGTKIVLEDKVGFPTSWVQVRMVPEMPVINTVWVLLEWC